MSAPQIRPTPTIRFYLRRASGVLLLVVGLLPMLLQPRVAKAADYTVTNTASCSAFLTAIGATGIASGDTCVIMQGTLAAGDTLTVAGNVSLRPQGDATNPITNFTNYGTVNINSAGNGNGGLYNAGIFANYGTLNFNGVSQNRDTINNYGTINVAANFYIQSSTALNNAGTIIVTSNLTVLGTLSTTGPIQNNGSIQNSGTIQVDCGGSITGNGTFTGNAVEDICPTTTPTNPPTNTPTNTSVPLTNTPTNTNTPVPPTATPTNTPTPTNTSTPLPGCLPSGGRPIKCNPTRTPKPTKTPKR